MRWNGLVEVLREFRLGLFAYKKMGAEHTYGSNRLPSSEVESMELLNQKLESLERCFPLTKR